MQWLAMLASLPLFLYCTDAPAYDWKKGDFSFTLNSRISVGAAWRVESRDVDLLGKLNVPGQQNLCADNCISFDGNPAPNQRLVDARGGYFGANSDNGDLNYDKGDIVAANAMLKLDFTGQWKDVTLKLRGLAFYDPVNSDFMEHHTDTRYQPEYTPRSDKVEDQIGARVVPLDAYISFPVNLWGKTLHVAVGQQRIRWGEANLLFLNSLAMLTPADENLLYTPGLELADVFQPVGIASASLNISENFSAQLVYQYQWKRTRPAAAGSFWSVLDVVGGGDYAMISLGQFSEDPQQRGGLTGTPELVTNTQLSVPIMPEDTGYPSDSGQFGIRLSGYLPTFNNGTEWGLYALNYHSRLPYAAVYAADASCARDASNIATALLACGGFNGLRTELLPSLLQLAQVQNNTALVDAVNTVNTLALPGEEPLPIDTVKVFLDYPEDIHMFGASFNTTLGLWSLAGELTYRPNLPLQVSVSDVLFAALQPAFPRQDLNLVVGVVPGARNGAPDYLETRYRGHDVQPNQLIRGYERMKVGQIDITGLRSFSSSNPFKANTIIWLLEAGATKVFNMPKLSQLQFEGGGANASHYSPGADGTGSGGVPDSRRFNPHQQTDGFATSLSWGVRSVVRMEYDNLLFGWNYFPLLLLSYDVDGVAPFPIQNFLEGRIQYAVGTEVHFNQDISMTLVYQGWAGGKDLNKLRDRDYVAVSMAYNF